jgi:hypothetical protein
MQTLSTAYTNLVGPSILLLSIQVEIGQIMGEMHVGACVRIP